MADEITLKSIADSIEKVEKSLSGSIEKVAKSVEDLAIITKSEFEKIGERFERVDARFENVERSLEEIKMKFAYTAWAIDLKDLEKRVKFLEDKVK
jgi:methyl-accepting chemotaxis protein